MNDAPGFLEQGELAVQAGQTIFCWADNILLDRQYFAGQTIKNKKKEISTEKGGDWNS